MNYPAIRTIGWPAPGPTDLPGTFSPQPLVVEVTVTVGGSPVAGVLVTVFTQGAGSGQISETNDNNGLATILHLRTGMDGRIQVYFKHPAGDPPVPTQRLITAKVGSTLPTGDGRSVPITATTQFDYHYPNNTVGLSATEAIDNRINTIATNDVDNALKVFSTQDHNPDPPALPTYVRNTAAWCYDLRQQMTCISPWNSSPNDPGGATGAGTAITAQHMILSAHYELPVDTTVRFITANNVVVEGIIRGKARHPAYDDRIHYPDLTIYTLETPLPPSITPCKMLPANYAAYLSYLENGRPPVMILNKEEKALVHELRFIGAFNDRLYALVPGPFTHFVRPGLHGKRLEFFRGLVPGDSGNPEFLIINDTLVLLSTTTFSDGRGSFVTPQISTLNAMIAAADAHAASRGYPLPTEQQGQTVQTIDLSAFTTFTPSP